MTDILKPEGAVTDTTSNTAPVSTAASAPAQTVGDLADPQNPVWQQLRQLAVAALAKSYSPYSNYPVGAAAITTDGRYYYGCNIENASYGLTLCAECSLISQMIMDGGGKLAGFLCVNKEHDIIVPCGRCRQLLYEHGGKELILEMPNGLTPMSSVLPLAFGPDDLEKI